LYLPTNTKYIFGLPTPNIFLANQYQIYSWLTNTKYILGLPSPNIFLAYQHQIYFVWKKTKFLQCRFLAHSSFNNVYMCFCYFVQLYSGSKLPVFFKIFPHHVWREVKCQAEGFCIFQLRCNILTELKKKNETKGGEFAVGVHYSIFCTNLLVGGKLGYTPNFTWKAIWKCITNLWWGHRCWCWWNKPIIITKLHSVE